MAARRTALLLVTLLLTVGFLSLLPPGVEAAANNLLSNPGFETSPDTDWTPWGTGCTTASSTGWSASGARSWYVNDASSGVSCGVYQEVSAAGGYRYEATAVLNVVSGTPGVHIRWVDGGGNDVAPSFPVHVVSKTGVQFVHLSGVAPYGTTFARIWFYSTTSRESEFYVDDVTASLLNPNQVTNPGFESGSAAPFTLWGSPCTLITSTAWSNAGARSFRLGDPTSSASCGVYQTIPVTPGVVYDARLVVKPVTGVIGFHMRWVDAWGSDVTPSFPVAITSGTDVNVLRLQGTAPAGAVNVRLWAYSGTTAIAEAYLDDFYFTCFDADVDIDGLPGCLEAKLGTNSGTLRDTDADGLEDFIEWDAHPSIFGAPAASCHRMAMSQRGADCPHPTMSDIFVEVDYMPTYGMGADVITTVTNLFGSHAIRLHVDQGALGGGNQIAHQDNLDAATKQKYYDSNGVTGFTQARKGYFHYAIMAHYGPTGCDLLEKDVPMGHGRTEGDEFWVYYGCVKRKSLGATIETTHFTTVWLQELGHNLFGDIEPSVDQYSSSDSAHDSFVAYAMYPNGFAGSPDYHPRRWSCVGSGDAQCDIDDIGKGIVGKAIGVPP